MTGTVADLLVDTDVCIDHLEGTRRLPRGRGHLAYSVITRAELLAGPAQQHDAARRLLAPLREMPIDRRIAEQAGALRREAGLRLPDALVAATALVHHLALHTRNRRGFRKVAGLRLR
jgi:predicted nucleic acid-binding protein